MKTIRRLNIFLLIASLICMIVCCVTYTPKNNTDKDLELLEKSWIEYTNERMPNGYKIEGDYFYFGFWPQTIKSNEVKVGTSVDEKGYYTGSDGDKYARFYATPSGSNKFSNGLYVSYAEYYFKVEPIKWKILSITNGEALVLCEKIIDGAVFDRNSNNYSNSDIRKYLNNEFYSTAFSSLQQQLISNTFVDNSASSTGYNDNILACENTYDKIILLSYQEATCIEYGFSIEESRIKKATDYSIATGVYTDTSISNNGAGNWWLRSPHHDYENRTLCSSYYYGNINGETVNYINGIVPALRIFLV